MQNWLAIHLKCQARNNCEYDTAMCLPSWLPAAAVSNPSRTHKDCPSVDVNDCRLIFMFYLSCKRTVKFPHGPSRNCAVGEFFEHAVEIQSLYLYGKSLFTPSTVIRSNQAAGLIYNERNGLHSTGIMILIFPIIFSCWITCGIGNSKHFAVASATTTRSQANSAHSSLLSSADGLISDQTTIPDCKCSIGSVGKAAEWHLSPILTAITSK